MRIDAAVSFKHKGATAHNTHFVHAKKIHVILLSSVFHNAHSSGYLELVLRLYISLDMTPYCKICEGSLFTSLHLTSGKKGNKRFFLNFSLFFR